jgi:hypothetical protein
LLCWEHFLYVEDKASVEETQENKQNSPKGSPHETGNSIDGASSSKEDAIEVNLTEDKIQVADSGEINFLRHVQHSLVCNRMISKWFIVCPHMYRI